jgi:hypothetical protein
MNIDDDEDVLIFIGLMALCASVFIASLITGF